MDISKTRYIKLVTHVESHASAVSLLASEEQRYIKAINNNKNTDDDVVIDEHVRMVVRQELSLS